MFEALIDVLKQLVAELKRYNDGRGTVADLPPPQQSAEPTPPKAPAAKAPAAKAPAAKAPAAKAPPATPTLDFATVQQKAIKFSALFGKESIGAILVDLGVPVATGDAKPKLSNAKEDPALLAKILQAMEDVAKAAEASTDPTA